MAACRIVNDSVARAVDSILEISESLRTAGEEFVSNLNAAIAEMEGEAKDALKLFIDKDVNDFVSSDLPNAIKGMADLLEANRSNFELLDRQLADSINGN